MDLSKLEEILKDQPGYRIDQAREAILRSLISDWQGVVGLPQDIRKRLEQDFSLEINAKIFSSQGGDSLKALVTLSDGLKVETVLMRHQDGRNTVCVSSQIGCPMACAFCATGRMGLKRNLMWYEIIEQVVLFARILGNEGERVGNIVFMGMGEPLLNYDNVVAAIKLINDPKGLGIGARHISISTCGIVEGIERLIDEPLQVNLAISLHAPNDILRSRLMPANIKYPIDAVFTAILRYVKNTNRRVMLEYIMIDGVNDSDDCAKELANLIRDRLSLKLAFVNLIRYNATGKFKPSGQGRVDAFKKILEAEHIEVTERYRFGRGIKAACGQLANK